MSWLQRHPKGRCRWLKLALESSNKPKPSQTPAGGRISKGFSEEVVSKVCPEWCWASHLPMHRSLASKQQSLQQETDLKIKWQRDQPSDELTCSMWREESGWGNTAACLRRPKDTWQGSQPPWLSFPSSDSQQEAYSRSPWGQSLNKYTWFHPSPLNQKTEGRQEILQCEENAQVTWLWETQTIAVRDLNTWAATVWMTAASTTYCFLCHESLEKQWMLHPNLHKDAPRLTPLRTGFLRPLHTANENLQRWNPSGKQSERASREKTSILLPGVNKEMETYTHRRNCTKNVPSSSYSQQLKKRLLKDPPIDKHINLMWHSHTMDYVSRKEKLSADIN